jgi:hypothetical protein
LFVIVERQTSGKPSFFIAGMRYESSRKGTARSWEPATTELRLLASAWMRESPGFALIKKDEVEVVVVILFFAENKWKRICKCLHTCERAGRTKHRGPHLRSVRLPYDLRRLSSASKNSENSSFSLTYQKKSVGIERPNGTVCKHRE